LFLLVSSTNTVALAETDQRGETGKAAAREFTPMKEGTFLVTTAEDEAATLRDVHDRQVITRSRTTRASKSGRSSKGRSRPSHPSKSPTS